MRHDANRDAEQEVERLTEELAEVARATARLLLTPRYDEAKLAELDRQRSELRTRIREISPTQDDLSPLELRHSVTSGGRLVSGG